MSDNWAGATACPEPGCVWRFPAGSGLQCPTHGTAEHTPLTQSLGDLLKQQMEG